MNAKAGDKHYLTYERKDLEEPAWGTVRRVCELDKDSKFIAVPKLHDDVQHIWVTFNRGGKLFLLRLDRGTGRLIAEEELARE